MDAGVQEAEQPDRWSHVAHTSPHAHHCTSVMVGLEGGRLFALGENDNGVNDLVKLGEVEEPSVESEALVPETPTSGQGSGSDIILAGSRRNPSVLGWGVCDGVGESSWAVELAQRVNDADDAVRAGWAWDGGRESLPHSDESPG